MIKCTKCGAELSDTVKFCKNCGERVEQNNAKGIEEVAKGKTACPKCGAELLESAKFCGKCGNKIERVEATVENNSNNLSNLRGFVRWCVQNGQLAAKITEEDFAAYETARGIIIEEGTKAIFFVDGKIVGQLDAGKYDMLGREVTISKAREEAVRKFAEDRIKITDETKKKGLLGLIGRTFVDTFIKIPIEKKEASNEVRKAQIQSDKEQKLEEIQREKEEKIKLGKHASVILVRGAQFHLMYEFNDMPTANIRSKVAVHIVAEISNLHDFYVNELLDTKFVSFRSMADKLRPNIEYAITNVISGKEMQNINMADALTVLKQTVAEQCQYITVKYLLKLSATNEEIEKLRKFKEELYVSEQTLTETQRRWNFQNMLQSAENAQKLEKAKTSADFDKLMHEISLQSQQEKSDFDIAEEKIRDNASALRLIMATEKFAREAKTDDEKEALTQQYLKNGILREEEMSVLNREIEQRARMAELNDEAAYDMAALKNKRAYDEEQLNWEIAIGNKQREIQFDRERKQAEHEVGTDRIKTEYSDERRAKDAQFEDERKRAAMDLEKEELKRKLEVQRQQQTMWDELEKSKHTREMEAENAKREFELEQKRIEKETELGKIQSFKEMTFEQIMAANPNISPEAAQALAEKFKAQAAGASTEEMKEFMLKQQGMTMELMQQILGNQKNADKEALDAKQREIDFVKDTAKTEQDRYMTGVTTAISSVSGAFAGEKKTDEGKTCPKCGKKNQATATFCEECGSSLK